MTTPRHRERMRVGMLIAVVCVAAPIAVLAAAQPPAAKYAGRPLAEALRTLQESGLRLVFSSKLVTSEMRVASEPRATAARDVLAELLQPHGLRAVPGPAGVIQVIRAKPPRASGPGKPIRSSILPKRARAPESPAYSERVMVRAPGIEGSHRGVASAVSLAGGETSHLRSELADDPMRAVQALPRVATGDDFSSEFSVRGSPYRHIGVVVDGIATPWLQHAAYGYGDAGSVAMFTTDVLEQATLQAGAYPRRFADTLGAQLDVRLRQGSRAATHLRGALSGTSGTLLAEGPIGRAKRGSWLVGFRRSYLDWPIRRRDEPEGTAFGFADTQAKLVYDLRPSQQITVDVLAGQSNVDGPDDRRQNGLADGTNRTAVVSAGWRSTVGPHLVIGQRAHLVAHEFFNRREASDHVDRARDGALSYRVELLRQTARGMFEAGSQVQRVRASRCVAADMGLAPALSAVEGPDTPHPPCADGFDASAWLRSGYAHFTWTAMPGLTIAPGFRISDSTLVGRTSVGRWVLGAWSFRPGWTVNASTGISHQFAEFEQVFAGTSTSIGPSKLRPEAATHVEVGLEQRLAKAARWQVTAFSRTEREILRAPDRHPRLVDGVVAEPAGRGRYENALIGSSRGIEVLLERRSTTGLSGWVAYSYGKARYTDAHRAETYWADFDQRHALNLSGAYALSRRARVAVKFRAGSNFPMSGYLATRDATPGLFIGTRRNGVRLPCYARLDLRAQRTFGYTRRRLTVFVEILNVLNRTNVGPAAGVIAPSTGEASGFTEKLFPRLPSAGIRIEF